MKDPVFALYAALTVGRPTPVAVYNDSEDAEFAGMDLSIRNNHKCSGIEVVAVERKNVPRDMQIIPKS